MQPTGICYKFVTLVFFLNFIFMLAGCQSTTRQSISVHDTSFSQAESFLYSLAVVSLIDNNKTAFSLLVVYKDANFIVSLNRKLYLDERAAIASALCNKPLAVDFKFIQPQMRRSLAHIIGDVILETNQFPINISGSWGRITKHQTGESKISIDDSVATENAWNDFLNKTYSVLNP